MLSKILLLLRDGSQARPGLVRWARALFSFVAVVAIYVVYSQTLARMIEPSAAPRSHTLASGSLRSGKKDRSELKSWFREGDWELTSKIYFSSRELILITEGYSTNPAEIKKRMEGVEISPELQKELKGTASEKKHRLLMTPCTMVFLTTENGAENATEEARKQAIVLRAPAGALLDFDAPLDLARGDLGNLIGGTLLGDISITSDQKADGPEDDLEIRTREVRLVGNRIATPNAVEFRFGPNEGFGRRMAIELMPNASGDLLSNPSIRRAKSFELAEQVRMRIVPGDNEMFPGAKAPAAPTDSSAESKPGAPVDITCAGRFQFDLVAYRASFYDKVEVTQAEPGAESNTLRNCDVLSIFFVNKPPDPNEPPEAADADKLPRLKPSRLEARGAPLVLRAPAKNVRATAETLDYDIESGSARLGGKREAEFYQGRNEIHARELTVVREGENQIGEFRAEGKGWLRGEDVGRDPNVQGPPRIVKSRWNDRLHFRRVGERRLLSVEGAGHVEVEGEGALDGDMIELWLQERPTAEAGKTEFTPEQLTAKGRVVIASPRLTGQVKELGVWFETPAPDPATLAPATLAPIAPQGSIAKAKPVGIAAPGQLPAPANAKSKNAFSSAFLPEGKENDETRYAIDADKLQVRVFLASTEQTNADLREVIAQGRVAFREVPLARPLSPKEEPLRILGDKLHLQQPTPEKAIVRVEGNPAHVERQGVSLDGGDAQTRGLIVLDQGTNRAWSPQSGSMRFPVSKEEAAFGSFGIRVPVAAAQPSRPAGALEWMAVRWGGRMDFDGQRATIVKRNNASAKDPRSRVVAETGGSEIITDQLDVTLTGRVTFGRGGSERTPEVDKVYCVGGVELVNRASEGNVLKSVERLFARDLTLDRRSGDFVSQGPGLLSRVGVDEGGGQFGIPGAAGTETRPRKPGELQFLGMRFNGDIKGNIDRKVATFHNRVRAVYGPVKNWNEFLDPDDFKSLPDQFLLTSDALTVADVAAPEAKAAFEMQATGNARAEGDKFTAHATRISYSSVKELIILDGDGLNKAKLFKQERPGAQRETIEAGKILFWPRTNQAEVNDAVRIEAMGFGEGLRR